MIVGVRGWLARGVATIGVLLCCTVAAAAGARQQAAAEVAGGALAPRVNVAFFNGRTPPVDQLQAFDAVVVDPASGFEPSRAPLAHTTWIASVRTSNDADHAAASADDFVTTRIEPLWQRGYRGFALDAADPGALGAIDAIVRAHPSARLIVGGAGALQAARPHARALYAVVGPPLVRGPSGDGGVVRDVPADERTTRVDAARAFMHDTGVPVLSLETCARTDRRCARDTAARVVATGVTPYVTDAARDIVGIGAIEVLPRKVLVVQVRDLQLPLDLSPGVELLATPLNYLGYDVEYADLNGPLPDDVTPDRYAGVVVWSSGGEPADPAAWRRWVDARIADRVPVAFFGGFGFDAADEEGAALDLQPVQGPFAAPLAVLTRDPMMGFEIDPAPDPANVVGVVTGAASRPLLRVRTASGVVDEAAITPWGGYTFDPYTVVSLQGIDQQRWAIQPIAFLTDALRLVPMPAPSVTTENGRRLFMSHVDGDGFASRAEFPGPDYSGEALYERIFTRYKVPMTLSVIEGEVGPAGLYPQISPRLEAIARKMFALPYVQIGTHTYSHPFRWELVDGTTGDLGAGGDAAFSLNIPGYRFDIDREITGSIDYINSRLAPPGKKVDVLQWPGDCMPPAVVIRKVVAAGVANVNGGDTVIRKGMDSWTNIAPIGVDKGPGAYQVYAPDQDENVYTNDWRGPFYGFTQVLQTYDMTGRPLRFKPIDLYYHMYSGTKLASLRALDEIFSTVLKEPVLPLFITDYTQKVLDWRTFAVAREVSAAPGAQTWIVRGNGNVRELRWPGVATPGVATPDLARSEHVTGYAPGPDGTYIHIADGAARVVFDADASANALPYVAEANAFIRDFDRTPNGMTFSAGGYYAPFVTLAHANACRASAGGRALAVSRSGDRMRFELPASTGQRVDYLPVEIDCGN